MFYPAARTAPYFQVLGELLHVDFLHEDEVPEADIGVYSHGGGVSLCDVVSTEPCACCVSWRELCDTEAVSWVVDCGGTCTVPVYHCGLGAGLEQSRSSGAGEQSRCLTLLHRSPSAADTTTSSFIDTADNAVNITSYQMTTVYFEEIATLSLLNDI